MNIRIVTVKVAYETNEKHLSTFADHKLAHELVNRLSESEFKFAEIDYLIEDEVITAKFDILESLLDELRS